MNIHMNLQSSVRVGTRNLVGRRKPCRKSLHRSLTKVYTFVSDSIGCDKVEIIMITRAKGEFGLRFKNGLFKEI